MPRAHQAATDLLTDYFDAMEAKDHRTVLNGIVWVLRTGALGRDLPERYEPWQTVHSRFRRWREAGIWDRILSALQAEGAHDDDLDGSLAMIDGINVRAHQLPTVRERERLRPATIEGLGRRVHRARAPLWARNGSTEIRRLLGAVDASRAGPESNGSRRARLRCDERKLTDDSYRRDPR